VQPLAILKALGDNTRYAIYLEIARSPSPRSTSEIADTLGLHANTVRPHLERMREVGLLDVEIDARGSVGRPQHRYFMAADAPSLGLEPPAFPMLASMLATVAAQSLPAGDDIAEVGRSRGRDAAEAELARAPRTDPTSCVSALVTHMDTLGFDPATATDATGVTTMAFTHCPYRELAEAHPQLVCHLHRGIVEGWVDAWVDALTDGGAADGEYATADAGLRVSEFHTLVDREPCQVSLTSSYAGVEE
jgi:predicted ArsR family transcriptional regulator